MKYVHLSAYDPRWNDEFRRCASALRRVFGSRVSAIYHIGSTAIPGLAAKPVIDILLTVRELSHADDLRRELEAAEFEWKGEYGIAGRRFLSRPVRDGAPGVHVHIFEAHHPEVNRHLLFRDLLRKDTQARNRYSALKQELAGKFANDRDAYQAGKRALIDELDQLALVDRLNYREPVQVHVLAFRNVGGDRRYLMLRRSEKTGGFWQGVTGAPEHGEKLIEGARRELMEETRIEPLSISYSGYAFSFGLERESWSARYREEVLAIDEYVFLAEVKSDAEPVLSSEHTEYRWATFEEAIALLKWESNKEALAYVHSVSR